MNEKFSVTDEAERTKILNNVAREVKQLSAFPLHYIIEFNNTLHVQRVPGGWNYIYRNADARIEAVVFIPFPKSIDANI